MHSGPSRCNSTRRGAHAASAPVHELTGVGGGGEGQGQHDEGGQWKVLHTWQQHVSLFFSCFLSCFSIVFFDCLSIVFRLSFPDFTNCLSWHRGERLGPPPALLKVCWCRKAGECLLMFFVPRVRMLKSPMPVSSASSCDGPASCLFFSRGGQLNKHSSHHLVGAARRTGFVPIFSLF
jgi:hypothetical protein